MALLKVLGILLVLAVLFFVPLAGVIALAIHLGASAGVVTAAIVIYALAWFALVEHNWDRFDPAARREAEN